MTKDKNTMASLIDIWRQIIVGDHKSWVLFGNGTCVILMKPEQDLARQATELLKKFGPVHVGSPAGDFSVRSLRDRPDWVVGCHHPDILTYVSPEEVEKGASDMVVGLLGRSKRDQDARQLEILHIETKPSAV